ncbi:MAG: hypothetical protein WCI72_00870 [archaeon]
MTDASESKIGNLVRIVDTKGWVRGKDKNAYYNGGNTDEVALGSKGRVTDMVGYDWICTRLLNGTTWRFHGGELEVVPPVVTSLPGIENFQRQTLFSMSESAPLVLMKGKVYSQGEQLSTEQNTGDIYTVRGEKESQVFRLEEMGDLTALEKFYVNMNLPKIRKMQEAYIAEVLEDINFGGTVWRTSDLSPAYKKILFDRAVVDLTNGVKETRKNLDLEKLVNGEGDAIENKKISALLGVEDSSEVVSYNSLANKNVLISEGKVHLLKLPEAISLGQIRVNNITYKIEEAFTPSTQLEQEHQKLFSQELRRRTLGSHLTPEIIAEILAEEVESYNESLSSAKVGSLLADVGQSQLIKPATLVSSANYPRDEFRLFVGNMLLAGDVMPTEADILEAMKDREWQIRYERWRRS